MFLSIKNIGKISEAHILLNGITVIAGENDTGKSTVGKVLFCIFNSFYKIGQQIYDERIRSIGRILETFYHETTNRLTRRFDVEDIAESIYQKKEVYISDEKLLQREVRELLLQNDEYLKKYLSDEKLLSNMCDKIIAILNISDEEVFKTVLQKKLESEFSGQISNIYFIEENGQINLRIKESDVQVFLKDNEVIEIVNSFSLNTEVIYMDDPFALDDLRSYSPFRNSNYTTHRMHLKLNLTHQSDDSGIKDVFKEILATKRLDAVFKKINIVCNGEMVQTKRSMFGYKTNDSDAILDVKNISTGLKTFVILKTLLLNGVLEENGTIVLDEPEIHLHPEWQLIFAELIVMIQKEFGMHILLNTHSPYFLNAIEVYSAKYEIADKCKYYLAENSKDNKSIITDVSDNIELIYEKLARPLQDLENERYSND